MGELVNLNKYRKAKQRLDGARQAAINRGKFGRSKADTERERQARRRTTKALDGKRLDPGAEGDGEERR